jgi:anti-sigma B factor antagonist
VDCSGLRSVDSSGLGALVRALTTSQHEGGGTKLLGVPSTLRKLLELTKLDSVFEMYERRDEAISSF